MIDPSTKPNHTRAVEWILWAFMATSFCLVVSIGAIIQYTADAPPGAVISPYGAAAVAAVLFMLSAATPPLMKRRAGPIASIITGLALAEGVALVGLVYSLAGGGVVALAPFAGASALLYIYHVPRG